MRTSTQSKNISLLLLIILGQLACSSITAPIGDEITLEPSEKALKITNNGNRTLYFFVVEGEAATHINFTKISLFSFTHTETIHKDRIL